MAEHPGVVFKDGPSGRRAALAFGPDVWEIIKVLREIDERGPAAITAAADVLVLPEAKVRVGCITTWSTQTRSTPKLLKLIGRP